MSFKTISLSLALSALGVAACTITSGTVDDTGVRNQGPDIPTADSGDTDTDTDAGSDAATDSPILTCDANLQTVKPIVSAACQACLDANCCTQLTTCFNKTGIDTSLSGDCNEIQGCYYNDCANSTDKPSCIAGCDSGNPAVSTEWSQVRSCGTTSCATECAGINAN